MKRLFDIAASSLLLLILGPLIFFVSCLVYVNLGAPIIFTQTRVGLSGAQFNIYKFRTMLNSHAVDGAILPDVDRLTRFGRFLRSTSLDELPELWNVLKGEMSLVGPRPLLVEYLPLYSTGQARRHEVRPGLTGLAQVNGRNSLSWEEKFRLDVWYVDHRSFYLDLKILLRTVGTVLSHRGIKNDGHSTMPPFTGRPPST